MTLSILIKLKKKISIEMNKRRKRLGKDILILSQTLRMKRAKIEAEARV